MTAESAAHESDWNSAIRIRQANPDDWEIIADFNTRLAAETEGKTLVPQTIQAGVKALLANPHRGRYFVACVGNRIIGQLMHTHEWSDWRNGEIWWLQSVYVDSQFRQRGVFRALFNHLAEMAAADPNVIGLRLYADTQNLRALDVYRSLGLADAGYLVMERFFRNAL